MTTNRRERDRGNFYNTVHFFLSLSLSHTHSRGELCMKSLCLGYNLKLAGFDLENAWGLAVAGYIKFRLWVIDKDLNRTRFDETIYLSLTRQQ